jgi:hypothetical protein
VVLEVEETLVQTVAIMLVSLVQQTLVVEVEAVIMNRVMRLAEQVVRAS